MNIVDIFIVMFFLMLMIVGFKHGVIREMSSLIGIILVFIISFKLRVVLGNFLCLICPFISFKGVFEGLSVLNILFYQTVAFIIVFSLLLSLYQILLKVSKLLQKLINMTIILWLPSKLLGLVVGFVKAYLITIIILLVLYLPFRDNGLITESTLGNTILNKTPVISNTFKSYINPIEEIYELGLLISDKKIDSKSANDRGIDIMLKYNIISKDTLKKIEYKMK